MKCLEKHRARRYETANGLARDVERHLNSEPVAAGPPSNLYRLQKLVHRKKGLFVATGAVALALVLGLGLSTWLFFRERAGRREQARLRQQAQTEKNAAQAEAAKSHQVAEFLKDMLNSVSPSVALGQDTTHFGSAEYNRQQAQEPGNVEMLHARMLPLRRERIGPVARLCRAALSSEHSGAAIPDLQGRQGGRAGRRGTIHA